MCSSGRCNVAIGGDGLLDADRSVAASQFNVSGVHVMKNAVIFLQYAEFLPITCGNKMLHKSTLLSFSK